MRRLLRLLSQRPVSGRVTGVALCSTLLAPSTTMTPRDEKLAELSEDVFSRGNVHLKNVTALSALPEGLHSFPEVCFIGKPNVGKSSIISSLLHNERLARGGCQRGTTRLLQFFNVGDALLLVDTPGYGGWRGRHLSQNLAERASAFAILFRYLALRKRGALKRVYWVVEAEQTIQPRDEELLHFLREEQIPFSIIVNKIDRFHGDATALQRYMENVWEFVGTDSVPVLGVRASPRRPERCLNMAALQHDIVHYCTQEITRLEDLTYRGLRDLSYAPPLVEEISAIERRYPLESFIVPEEDNLSLEQFVSRHETTKARFLAKSPQAACLSEKQMAEGHLLNSSCSSDGEDVDNNKLANENLSRMSPPDTFAIPLTTSATSGKINHPAVISDTAVVRPRHLSVRGSLRKGLLVDANEGFCPDVDQTDVVACASESLEIRLGVQPETASPLKKQQRPQGLAWPPPLVEQHLPPSLDRYSHSVRAINGVPIPKSMITASVAQLSAEQEGSFEHYAQRSGAGAYDALTAPDVGEDGTFVESTACAFMDDKKEVPRRRSARKQRQEQLLRKYVERKRKERSIYLHAQGYMCPWLAGAGQASREAVVGLASSQSSISRGGGSMKGLKFTGFGGKSYSTHTMKNRGRSTKKVGFWAA